MPGMTTQMSLLAGAVIGLAVAVPIGPMGMLCIQRTLASGMRTGVCTGLGGITATVLYAAVVMISLDTLAPLMAESGRVLNLAAGVFLLWSALRILRRRNLPRQPGDDTVMSPVLAYGTAVAFNIGNPLSPVLIMALLAPMLGLGRPSLAAGATLLLGMFMAGAAWWVCLAGGVSLLRRRLSPRLLAMVNRIAGGVLIVYAVRALARSVGS
jgi:threonine/homoserine/homoserine lactone efflux protein